MYVCSRCRCVRKCACVCVKRVRVRGKLAMLELHIKESSHKTYLQKSFSFAARVIFFTNNLEHLKIMNVADQIVLQTSK